MNETDADGFDKKPRRLIQLDNRIEWKTGSKGGGRGWRIDEGRARLAGCCHLSHPVVKAKIFKLGFIRRSRIVLRGVATPEETPLSR